MYFSPDGKKILYSDSFGRLSSVKRKYLDPADIFDLYMYDIPTGKEEKIFDGSDDEDVLANGWADNHTIRYDLVKYSESNGDIKEDTTSYRYDLDTKESVKEDTSKK